MIAQMSEKTVLTVILAVKDAEEKQLTGCMWSVASLRNSRSIDLVIVSSGRFPGLADDCKSLFRSVKVVESAPLGVYSAYNRGLDERLGEYVLFLGVDDVVLPGLDRVIDMIMSLEDKPDFIPCYSLMQDVGLSGPSKIRGALMFRNWCHQGLLYGSKLFAGKRFDVKYKVQADHKFNLELMADKKLKVLYRNDVITHFASGGLTSTFPDLLFRADMPSIVRNSYGNFYWLIALAKRKLSDLVKGDPTKRT